MSWQDVFLSVQKLQGYRMLGAAHKINESAISQNWFISQNAGLHDDNNFDGDVCLGDS